jgi:hypothetical protein
LIVKPAKPLGLSIICVFFRRKLVVNKIVETIGFETTAKFTAKPKYEHFGDEVMKVRYLI